MRDFLVQVASEAQAMAAMPQWTMIDPDSGKTVWKNPTWCGVLPVDAYTSVGAPAVYADDGETVVKPVVPPTKAPGQWFIVSVDREVKIPAKALPAIKAQADRDAGLTLPAGIAGLSTVWAGMTIRTP